MQDRQRAGLTGEPRATVHTKSVYARGGPFIMNKRLNIILPEETVRLLDRVAGKGQRSRFIHWLSRGSRHSRDDDRSADNWPRAPGPRDRDLRLAQEWLALDDETVERQQ